VFCATSGLLVLSRASLAAESAQPERAGAPASSVVLTGVAVGIASYKGDLGPWLELFVGRDFRLGTRVAFRLEANFLYASYAHDSSYQHVEGFEDLEIESTDDVWGIGGFARGSFSYDLSPHWALRAGVLLGFASMNMTSSHCGDASLSNPFHGLSAGAALRFGHEERLELGLLADFVAYPLMYCPNAEPARVHKRDELSYDDPTLVATGRFAFHW
jgi:hypothetical protein